MKSSKDIRLLILVPLLTFAVAIYSINRSNESGNQQSATKSNSELNQSESEFTVWGSFCLDFLGNGQ
jgi:hypothetical protein